MAGRADTRSRSPQPYRFRANGEEQQEDTVWDNWTTRLTHPLKSLPHATHMMTELRQYPSFKSHWNYHAHVGVIFCRHCGNWMKDTMKKELRQECPGMCVTPYLTEGLARLAQNKYPYKTKFGDHAAFTRRDRRMFNYDGMGPPADPEVSDNDAESSDDAAVGHDDPYAPALAANPVEEGGEPGIPASPVSLHPGDPAAVNSPPSGGPHPAAALCALFRPR